jgi:hypothetical protein
MGSTDATQWAAPGVAAEPARSTRSGTGTTPEAGGAPGLGLGSAGVAVARCDAEWSPGALDRELADNPLEGLAPVGVGGVLDGGFDLLRHRFGALVGLAAGILLPLQLLEVLGELQAGLDADAGAAGFNGFADPFAVGAASTPIAWLVLALRVVALSFLGVFTGSMVADLLRGRRRPTGQLLASAASRWWVAVLIPLLCVPVKSVGACLLYVGFFAADALLMCASVVAGAEGRGPLHAFGRSWRLAWQNYGTAIGISFGGFLIAVVLQVSLWVGPVLLAGQFVTSESVLLVVQQVSLLTLLVVQPLTACITARAYVELRCRAEGLDIQLRRERLGLR